MNKINYPSLTVRQFSGTGRNGSMSDESSHQADLYFTILLYFKCYLGQNERMDLCRTNLDSFIAFFRTLISVTILKILVFL